MLRSNTITGRPTPFLILTGFHGLLACIVLSNEVLAIFNRLPGGNFPIEHQASWARVFPFCGAAMVSAFMLWRLATRKRSKGILPPFGLSMFAAALLTLMSTLSNYPSVIGWCCEVIPTHYFGFPFSYIRGASPLGVFFNPDVSLEIHHSFLPYPFLLDLVFWSSLVFIVLSLSFLFFEKWQSEQYAQRSARTT